MLSGDNTIRVRSKFLLMTQTASDMVRNPNQWYLLNTIKLKGVSTQNRLQSLGIDRVMC